MWGSHSAKQPPQCIRHPQNAGLVHPYFRFSLLASSSFIFLNVGCHVMSPKLSFGRVDPSAVAIRCAVIVMLLFVSASQAQELCGGGKMTFVRLRFVALCWFFWGDRGFFADCTEYH